jgi:hypothetical protein
VGDIQGVVVVDVAVGVLVEVFEDVVFERVGIFYDEDVQIKLPEPRKLVSHINPLVLR